MVVRSLLVVLVVLVSMTAWVGWRGWQAATALSDVQQRVAGLDADLASADASALRGSAQSLVAPSDAAWTATKDPLWRLFSHLPLAGDQLTAVTHVAESVHDVVTLVLPPLLAAADELGPAALTPRDGRVDLAPIQAAAPHTSEAAEKLSRAARHLDAVDTADLWPVLAGRVASAQDRLGRLSAQVDEADVALNALPSILGADGPRSYLVLVLNPAELRSGGGIVGTVVEIVCDGGTVRVADQRAARDLVQPVEPILPLTPAEVALHGPGLGRFMQVVTATPDFERTATLASALWTATTGRAVDGVLSVDPVGLSYLLRETGPLTTPDGTQLTASTVATELLSNAYTRFPDPDASDAFFAEVAIAISTAVLSNGEAGSGIVDAIRHATSDGRLAFWSSDPGVAALFAGSSLDHRFLGGDDGASAGVFLNDATISKMDFYLRSRLSVTELSCSPRPLAQVELALSSTAPADAATALPEYVTGPGSNGVPRGSFETRVLLYSPVGGRVGEVRLTDPAGGSTIVGGTTARQDGREVTAVNVRLAPGESVTVQAQIELPGAVRSLEVVTTPTASGTQGGRVSAGCRQG